MSPSVLELKLKTLQRPSIATFRWVAREKSRELRCVKKFTIWRSVDRSCRLLRSTFYFPNRRHRKRQEDERRRYFWLIIFLVSRVMSPGHQPIYPRFSRSLAIGTVFRGLRAFSNEGLYYSRREMLKECAKWCDCARGLSPTLSRTCAGALCVRDSCVVISRSDFVLRF